MKIINFKISRIVELLSLQEFGQLDPILQLTVKMGQLVIKIGPIDSEFSYFFS